MNTREGKRNRWLDIVRALAITLVVNCHLATSPDTAGLSNAWRSVLGAGGHGVDLFFVLSGWLLGTLLLREAKTTGTVDISRFWKRRWLRTLPAYYAVLTATLVQAAWQDRLSVNQISYFVFLQGYVFEPMPFFHCSWSLCVEEHFYLVIAPAIIITKGTPKRSFGVISLFFIIPFLARMLTSHNLTHQTHFRLDQCAAGVLLACIHLHLPRALHFFQRYLPLFAFAAFMCGLVVIAQRLDALPGSSPLLVFTFMSLTLVAFAEHSDWFRYRVRIPGTHYLATRSYSIYLLHIEAIACTRHLDVTSFWTRFILTWILSILFAECLYRLIEQPFMRLREKRGATAEPRN